MAIRADAVEPLGRPAPLAWLPSAAAALAGLGYLAAERYTLGHLGFPLDDSFIHLQFARNLAAGRGLSYNPGQLVTGSTAPLWTALLSLLFHLPGSVFLWTKLAGIALAAAGADATRRLARELDLAPPLDLLAGLLVALTGPLAWGAVSGMEVPLFAVLSLWGMILHLRERRGGRLPLSLPVLALAALARPEGLLLLAFAVVDRLLAFRRTGAIDSTDSTDSTAAVTAAAAADPTTAAGAGAAEPADPPQDQPGELAWAGVDWRSLAIGLLLALCILAGPLLFYRAAGGSFLPTTYAAKGAAVRRSLPKLEYLYVVLGILFGAQPYTTLAALGGATALLARLGTRRDRGLLPALWVLGLPLVYSLQSPLGRAVLVGNFGRYYFPLFAPLAVLGLLGLEPAARALGRSVRLGRLRLPAGLAAGLLLLWPTGASLVEWAARYDVNVANVEDGDVRVARWLAPRLDPRAVLAVNDIGAFKYLLPNRVIDLVGISSPDVLAEILAAVARGSSAPAARMVALARRRPDYVVVFPTWFPTLGADRRFRLVQLVTIPDNMTMGSDQIGVYRTPWTRYPLTEPPPAPPAAAPERDRP
jgi:hypothetical protein